MFTVGSAHLLRLAALLRRMGVDAVVESRSPGDVDVRFSNSHDFGRFAAEAVRLLSGDEVIRIGTGCLATLSRRAAILICDRAQ